MAKLLFYPEPPHPKTTAALLCRLLGYEVRTDPGATRDAALFWLDATFRPRDAVVERLHSEGSVLNGNCTDISKRAVDRTFADAFGHGTMVDPFHHHGPYVEKSDLNARHDGVVREGPPPAPPALDRICQRLIDNRVAGGLTEDIRVPLFGGAIPFAYLKYQPVGQRFSETCAYTCRVEADEVLGCDEIMRLRALARGLGLDYGELDVLRDRGDGRLYVVDANATPFAPTDSLPPDEQRSALIRMAPAFETLVLGASVSADS